MTKSELKQLIKEVISDSLKNESLLKYSTNPKEVLANIIEIAEDDNMDDFNKVINMRALAKGYFDKVGYKVTNENYEDGIKDTKDRMAYLALRKQEKDYISKSKQSSSPIKKQHYMDMSKQVLDKALDILKKHKVVDESSTNENWKDNLKVGSAVGLMAAAGPIAGKLAPNVNVDGKVYKMTSRVPDNIKPQKVKTDDGKEVYIWQEPATGRHSHGQTNNLYVPVKQTNEANTKELQKLGFTPTKNYIKEVKGYVLSPMDQASTWIAWNKKPKNKNGKQMWVVSAADFQKQFPSIQMKELPAKPSSGADYYIIDSEGDLFPYSQANIGSGLD
jgi:hypothetical protein